jgi:acetaldehyde dehydrogenase (acetylating)
MKLKIGIIGTGNIGTDLLIKSMRSTFVEPVIFVGRRSDSNGIEYANKHGVNTSIDGLDFFIKNPNYCDVVFDCTDAFAAIENNKIFANQNIKVIDLTPAKLGKLCIPQINDDLICVENNVNMITCGGQASIPLLNLISQHCESLDYIEIVSQIASKSAGLATRINIDEYIHTTETAIKQFTNTKSCKVILNLNPADPCVDMQTTMFLKYKNIDMRNLLTEIDNKIKKINTYVPFYELISLPALHDNDILILSIKVKGTGDYLPSYAGNLDIINCAALKVTEKLIQ